MAKKIKCILSIAGSDPSAGAGIQSDLKTFKNYGLYGLSVITTITIQNTKGVEHVYPLSYSIVAGQLSNLLSDFKINVAKIGVLGSNSIINAISSILKRQKNIKLVIDPVIMSKNGFNLLDQSAVYSMRRNLLKLTYLLTPNLFEAQQISDINIHNNSTLELAMKKLFSYGCKNVLLKGGHFDKKLGIEPGTDILYDGKKFYFFSGPFIKTKNTHGIGCTFSAAIASNIALGYDLKSSIVNAKKYVIKSLKKNIKVGTGIGPVEI